MSAPQISIIGAGIGGLTLGRCLLRRGIHAVLYEKASSRPRHSYAITLLPTSYRQLLNELDIDESAFKSRVAVDAGIGGSGNIKTEGQSYCDLEPASFRAHRGKLEELMREGLDVRWEHDLQNVECKPHERMTLNFSNGQVAMSDIVLGVDGPHSVIRKQFLPSAILQISPYVAFSGKRKISREVFDKIYGSIFSDTTVVEAKHDGVVMSISINEATQEYISISWIYSRHAKGNSDALHKPARPRGSAEDVPEEFFLEIQAMTELSQPFADIFDVKNLRKERILHWLMRNVLVPKSELQQLEKKGIWLMGDAVHAEQIIGGRGANSAIDDGLTLAKYIVEESMTDFTSWYETRFSSWQKGQKECETRIASIHATRSSGGLPQQHL